jgi:hypothetical protein
MYAWAFAGTYRLPARRGGQVQAWIVTVTAPPLPGGLGLGGNNQRLNFHSVFRERLVTA